MTLPGYLPPALNRNSLRDKLGSLFATARIEDKVPLYVSAEDAPVLKTISVGVTHDMLDQLLIEYAKWWRLMILFKRQRIVAPPPVYMVSYAHFALGMETFFGDLFKYLGVAELHDRRWLGPEDIDGLLHTTVAYTQTFGDPTNPWMDMFRITEKSFDASKVVTIRS